MYAITHYLCHYCFCHGFQCLWTVLGYGKYFDGVLKVIKDFAWLLTGIKLLFQRYILLCEKIESKKVKLAMFLLT